MAIKSEAKRKEQGVTIADKTPAYYENYDKIKWGDNYERIESKNYKTDGNGISYLRNPAFE